MYTLVGGLWQSLDNLSSGEGAITGDLRDHLGLALSSSVLPPCLFHRVSPCQGRDGGDGLPDLP